MKITLFNSLTNKLETFVPIKEGEVTMYACGPTVYDIVHVGNLRPVVFFDTLRKLFTYLGYNVIYTSNFTDIDDKIIKKAIDEGVTEKEISDRYIKAYKEDVKALNALPPTYTPTVSDSMQEMIDFIELLVEKGGAYVIDGEVFFNVKSDPYYGELSNIRPEELEHGSRVEENEKKRNPGDFLLWKKTNEGITFPSPWGEGRPGWHTECVVMINKTFKQPLIDIHGGGFDLKFPHHENEIAQSRIVNGTHLANYWLHNGFININNEKMSKSLGNTLTGKEFLKKYDGNVLRFLLLSSHYRAPLNLTDDVILNAKTNVEKITNAIRQLHVYLVLNGHDKFTKEPQIAGFIEKMCDDLNTANAISELFNTVKEINLALRSKEKDVDLLQQLMINALTMCEILGIRNNFPEITQNDIQLYKEYLTAKKERNFARSDELRLLLTKRNIL